MARAVETGRPTACASSTRSTWPPPTGSPVLSATSPSSASRPGRRLARPRGDQARSGEQRVESGGAGSGIVDGDDEHPRSGQVEAMPGPRADPRRPADEPHTAAIAAAAPLRGSDVERRRQLHVLEEEVQGGPAPPGPGQSPCSSTRTSTCSSSSSAPPLTTRANPEPGKGAGQRTPTATMAAPPHRTRGSRSIPPSATRSERYGWAGFPGRAQRRLSEPRGAPHPGVALDPSVVSTRVSMKSRMPSHTVRTPRDGRNITATNTAVRRRTPPSSPPHSHGSRRHPMRMPSVTKVTAAGELHDAQHQQGDRRG